MINKKEKKNSNQQKNKDKYIVEINGKGSFEGENMQYLKKSLNEILNDKNDSIFVRRRSYDSEEKATVTFCLFRQLFVSYLSKGIFEIILFKNTKSKNNETTEIIKKSTIQPYIGHWVVKITTEDTEFGQERVRNQDKFESEQEAITFYNNSIPSEKELNDSFSLKNITLIRYKNNNRVKIETYKPKRQKKRNSQGQSQSKNKL